MGDKFVIRPSDFTLPDVVDDTGERVDPKVLTSVIQMAQLGQMVRLNRQLAALKESFARTEFQGKLDSRMLSATTDRQYLDLVSSWPYTPWIAAFLTNDGPDPVNVVLNDWPPHKDSLPMTLQRKETRALTLGHAGQRIERLYYYTDAGTASVRVDAQY